MSYESYSDQMKNPLWQKKRLHMLESKGWKCEVCGAEEKTLHVHHKQYKSGAKIWEYEDNELAVLCENCHKETHEILDFLKSLIVDMHPSRMRYFLSFIRAAYIVLVNRTEHPKDSYEDENLLFATLMFGMNNSEVYGIGRWQDIELGLLNIRNEKAREEAISFIDKILDYCTEISNKFHDFERFVELEDVETRINILKSLEERKEELTNQK